MRDELDELREQLKNPGRDKTKPFRTESQSSLASELPDRLPAEHVSDDHVLLEPSVPPHAMHGAPLHSFQHRDIDPDPNRTTQPHHTQALSAMLVPSLSHPSLAYTAESDSRSRSPLLHTTTRADGLQAQAAFASTGPSEQARISRPPVVGQGRAVDQVQPTEASDGFAFHASGAGLGPGRGDAEVRGEDESVSNNEPALRREIDVLAQRLLDIEMQNARLRDINDELQALVYSRAGSSEAGVGEGGLAMGSALSLEMELSGDGMKKGFSYDEQRALLRARIDLVT